jgi:hypothetical protein
VHLQTLQNASAACAGWGPRQYDLRPRWNAATRDRALEAVLDPGMSEWRTGVWFAGVVGGTINTQPPVMLL